MATSGTSKTATTASATRTTGRNTSQSVVIATSGCGGRRPRIRHMPDGVVRPEATRRQAPFPARLRTAAGCKSRAGASLLRREPRRDALFELLARETEEHDVVVA